MIRLRRGARGDAVVRLQHLLVREGARILIDGSFGPRTELAVRKFQADHDLVVDGIVGEQTWAALYSRHPRSLGDVVSRTLGESDVRRFAARFVLEVEVVKAVIEVESRGVGFLADRPVILFEPHIFWRQLKVHGYDPRIIQGAETADILYEKWKPASYFGGWREWGRLERARGICRRAADESASWGLFQVLGLHWKRLGYRSVLDFVARMHRHESEHLEAFGRYLEANDLVSTLRNRHWSRFARGYNGPAYALHRYDTRLERAYRKQSEVVALV